jgi:putative two-component system response regulator
VSRSSSAKKIIFLVDDDVTNLTIGKGVLSERYSVFTLNSGETMLKMLGRMLPKNRPDVILLDVNMPGMSGFEVISELKSGENACETSGIPVIFMTSFASTEEESEFHGRCEQAGALNYIVKPFDPELLLKRLEEVLK